MSYVDHTLITGETVRARAKLHWLIYIWPLIILLAGLALLFWGRDLGSHIMAFVVMVVGGVIALYGAAKCLYAFVIGYTTELAVTNFRVIAKRGIIERETVEQILNRVDSIEVTQSLLGRLFDFGTVMVTGTGVTHTPISMIADPLGFRRAVHTAIENHPQATGLTPDLSASQQKGS